MEVKMINPIGIFQCFSPLSLSALHHKRTEISYPDHNISLFPSQTNPCNQFRQSILPNSDVSANVASFTTIPPLKPIRCRPQFSVKVAVNDTKANEQGLDKEEGDLETGAVVVGAGLAGLAAARQLALQNVPFVLLEGSDGVGGRVRTDHLEGFLLDRGFQIFITDYPEAKRVLNYESLNLQPFYSGALVYYNGDFHRVADPLRHFGDSLGTLLNPIGTVFDKVLVGLARLKSVSLSDEDILLGKEVSINEKLMDDGFSSSMINRFFRPFFGGIFFDRELTTTSRLFDFVFKCLALGSNTLPAMGISAIPEQIASQLPQNSIFLNSRVEEIILESAKTPRVKLQNGRMIGVKYGLVLAVEEHDAARLLGIKLRPVEKSPRSTVCLYFSTDEAPIDEPILILNGSGEGIVNNMFFATNVAPSYGPLGKTLVSVSLVGYHENSSDDDLRIAVLKELSGWFGSSVVGSWKHLRTYRIRFAQPDQTPPTDLMKNPSIGSGVYLCGDYRDSATFDGALVSGRRAVETLVKDAKLSRVL
eukprot:Gb_00521 [translate_table: standard]